MSGNGRLGIVISVVIYLFLCSVVGFGTMLSLTIVSAAIGWILDGYKHK